MFSFMSKDGEHRGIGRLSGEGGPDVQQATSNKAGSDLDQGGPGERILSDLAFARGRLGGGAGGGAPPPQRFFGFERARR
jgi:hypothetical protein